MINICKIDNCEKLVHGNGLCTKHNQRLKINGHPLKLMIARGIYEGCSTEGCKEPHKSAGFCSKHFAKSHYHKDIQHSRELAKKFARSTKGKFRRARSKAKQHSQEFLLTEDEYRAITDNPCNYCGGALPETGSGLDRVNSAQGYTSANVVACCAVCNIMKNTLSEEQFYSHIERILSWRRK